MDGYRPREAEAIESLSTERAERTPDESRPRSSRYSLTRRYDLASYAKETKSIMEIPSTRGDVSMRDVLRALKFKEDWTVISDELPGYVCDFGNFQLSATQLTNQYFQPVFQFSGVMQDSRSLALVDFSTPLMVESLQQGTAWIADALLRHHLKPQHPPAWLAWGREWQDQLPWERDMRAYKARPQCEVDREWMRVAARKYREMALGIDEDAVVKLGFDGALFSIATAGTRMELMATGTAWQDHYFITFAHLLLPLKRLMQPLIGISIWEGHLHLGNYRLPLADQPQIE